MKKILSFKYIALYGIIAFVTLFMVFYIFINYTFDVDSKYKNLNYSNYEGDMSQEEFEETKNQNIFQKFLSLKEGFSFDTSYSKYCQIKIRIIPITIISIFFLYSNIKNKLIKYNIGRNINYNKENLKLKRRVALIPAVFSLLLVIILLVIGLVSTKNNFLTYFKFLYNHNDILNCFIFNNIASFICFEIFSFIGIYIFSLFSLEVVDRYGNIDGIIILLIISWIFPIITSGAGNVLLEINKILPHSVFFIGAVDGTAFLDLFIPVVILECLILWLRKLDYDKIEV